MRAPEAKASKGAVMDLDGRSQAPIQPPRGSAMEPINA